MAMVISYMAIAYGFWLYGHYLVGSWILIIGYGYWQLAMGMDY
jgi:hypothetical protein